MPALAPYGGCEAGGPAGLLFYYFRMECVDSVATPPTTLRVLITVHRFFGRRMHDQVQPTDSAGP